MSSSTDIGGVSSQSPIQQLLQSLQQSGVKPSAHLLVKALSANLNYQTHLYKKIDKIDHLSLVNNEKIRIIEKVVVHSNANNDSKVENRGITALFNVNIPQRAIYAAPWFIDNYGMYPPSNIDALSYLESIYKTGIMHNYVASFGDCIVTPYHFYLQHHSYLMSRELPSVQYMAYKGFGIPRLVYTLPYITTSYDSYHALWRSIISASLQFHIQQIQHIEEYLDGIIDEYNIPYNSTLQLSDLIDIQTTATITNIDFIQLGISLSSLSTTLESKIASYLQYKYSIHSNSSNNTTKNNKNIIKNNDYKLLHNIYIPSLYTATPQSVLVNILQTVQNEAINIHGGEYPLQPFSSHVPSTYPAYITASLYNDHMTNILGIQMNELSRVIDDQQIAIDAATKKQGSSSSLSSLSSSSSSLSSSSSSSRQSTHQPHQRIAPYMTIKDKQSILSLSQSPSPSPLLKSPYFDPLNLDHINHLLPIYQHYNHIDKDGNPIISGSSSQYQHIVSTMIHEPPSWLAVQYTSNVISNKMMQHHLYDYIFTPLDNNNHDNNDNNDDDDNTNHNIPHTIPHPRTHCQPVVVSHPLTGKPALFDPSTTTIPPLQYLLSLHGLSSSHFSTMHATPIVLPDTSNELDIVYNTITQLYPLLFGTLNNNNNDIIMNGSPYPFDKFPLQFLNYSYIAHHHTRHGFSPTQCYLNAVNQRVPNINSLYLFRIILFFYTYYQVMGEVAPSLGLHSIPHPDQIVSDDALKLLLTSYDTSVSIPIVITDTSPQSATTTIDNSPPTSDHIIWEIDIPIQLKCPGNQYRVDKRITLSFPIIFSLYIRALQLLRGYDQRSESVPIHNDNNSDVMFDDDNDDDQDDGDDDDEDDDDDDDDDDDEADVEDDDSEDDMNSDMDDGNDDDDDDDDDGGTKARKPPCRSKKHLELAKKRKEQRRIEAKKLEKERKIAQKRLDKRQRKFFSSVLGGDKKNSQISKVDNNDTTPDDKTSSQSLSLFEQPTMFSLLQYYNLYLKSRFGAHTAPIAYSNAIVSKISSTGATTTTTLAPINNTTTSSLLHHDPTTFTVSPRQYSTELLSLLSNITLSLSDTDKIPFIYRHDLCDRSSHADTSQNKLYSSLITAPYLLSKHTFDTLLSTSLRSLRYMIYSGIIHATGVSDWGSASMMSIWGASPNYVQRLWDNLLSEINIKRAWTLEEDLKLLLGVKAYTRRNARSIGQGNMVLMGLSPSPSSSSSSSQSLSSSSSPSSDTTTTSQQIESQQTESNGDNNNNQQNLTQPLIETPNVYVSWREVSAHLPGRTSRACRGRYLRIYSTTRHVTLQDYEGQISSYIKSWTQRRQNKWDRITKYRERQRVGREIKRERLRDMQEKIQERRQRAAEESAKKLVKVTKLSKDEMKKKPISFGLARNLLDLQALNEEVLKQQNKLISDTTPPTGQDNQTDTSNTAAAATTTGTPTTTTTTPAKPELNITPEALIKRVIECNYSWTDVAASFDYAFNPKQFKYQFTKFATPEEIAEWRKTFKK